jgi:phosphoserine phosphatase RsbU/P
MRRKEVVMAALEVNFLHDQLQKRKHRLEAALAVAQQKGSLASLLQEVDAALERMNHGTYGSCEVCHEAVEADRLLADPLVRYCLDHLSPNQRAILQRDLDLAAEIQRKLLPTIGLSAGGFETSHHYAPLGPVSGDYCDLIPSDGQLFIGRDLMRIEISSTVTLYQPNSGKPLCMFALFL